MGLPKEQLEGKTLWDFYPKDQADAYWKDDLEVINSGQPKRNIIEPLTLSDRALWVQTDKILYRDASGNIAGIIGFTLDITGRKQAEEELKSAQEKLIQAEKLATVGRLAAGVAHEINNPLAAIMISVQRLTGLIKNEGAANIDSEVYVKTLELVERATNNCKRIVAGLLAFSRPIKLQSASTDIHKVVEESLEVLEDQIKVHKVRVVNDFAPHLLIIKADKYKLGEVFSNLIVNACEAMPEGGQLRIATRLQQPGTEARREAMDEADKTVEIKFSDTGEGISDEDMFKIFDPFFSTKGPGKSVGLGLSVSYGIIQQHGGAIEVSSQKGKGTTFIVRLPVDRRRTTEQQEVTDGNRAKMGC